MSTQPNQPTHHFIQYGKQTLDESDIEAVAEVLRENKYLTTGPRVRQFEEAVKNYTGAQHAIAVNSGTAALHAAMYAINIQPGDEVIVPPLTFAATANCVVYQQGTPVFCDIEEDTLNIDPNQIELTLIFRRSCFWSSTMKGHSDETCV